MSERISDLMLDRFRLGELDAETTAQVKAALSEDAAAAARLKQLEADNQSFLDSANIANLAADARSKADAPHRGQWRAALNAFLKPHTLAGVTAVAIVGIFALILVPKLHSPPAPLTQPMPGGAMRLKGNTLKLLLHVKRADQQFKYDGKMRLHAGDQLRFVVSSAQSGVLHIVTQSEGQPATVYLPTPGESPTTLQAGVAYEVPDAYQLDSSDTSEVIHAILCPNAVSRDALKRLVSQRAQAPDSAKQCAAQQVLIQR